MKQRSPLFVYADTSVYGGVEDDEFADPSKAFFAAVRVGEFILFVSEVVRRELEFAPESVNRHFRDLLPLTHLASISEEALVLQKAYIDAGIVGKNSHDDALHVALATVGGCEMIVSWNFKHIVNYQKIPLFNAVNALQGYRSIAIYSPLEVVQHEK